MNADTGTYASGDAEPVDSSVPEDTGTPNDGGADPDSAVDGGVVLHSIVDVDISNLESCHQVCADLSRVCDDTYSWLFGAFNGGGFAEFGAGEIFSALPCSELPASTESVNGRDYQLSRFQCACL